MRRRYKVLNGVLILVALMLVSFGVVVSHDSPCGTAPPLAAGTPSMQAMVYRCYGPPANVKLETIAKPSPEDDRVVVKVKAASVNPLDWHYLRGKPYVMRLSGGGMGAPEDIRLGVDFAGTVDSVGRKVTRFKPGDAVFGGGDGSFAEYLSVREGGSLAMKPANMSFEQAAAVPIAAVTALQALRDQGGIQRGQKVLVNGASGGVGTFAVQIAKTFGAEVTGVCNTKNAALVKAIGADHVVDYTREDFTRGLQKYDLIVDTYATHSLFDYRRVLTPNGRVVIVGGPSNDPWIGPLWLWVKALVQSPFIKQKAIFFLAELNADALATLRDLMEAGKITPVVDRTYPLSGVPEALRYLEQGHTSGKVIITVQ